MGLILITGLFTLLSHASSNMETKELTRLLNQCSGHLSDMNCYQKIIKDVAHEQNVREGMVPSNSKDRALQNIQKAFLTGKRIVVDTFDKASCEEVRQSFNHYSLTAATKSMDMSSLCESDSQHEDDRYREITLMWETTEEYFTPINIKFLTDTEHNLATTTRNLNLMMIGTMGLFWVLPESVSNWNRDQIKRDGFLQTWRQNSTSSPAKDNDHAVLNHIIHPLVGSMYYSIVRGQGYSRMQSFGYSVIMSTFFWEYGWEAGVERPSIQDLILTPVIGSLIGETFFQASQRIKNNNEEVLGSQRIGRVILFLLNPAEQVSKELNRTLGQKFVQSAQTDFVLTRRRDPIRNGIRHNYIGVQLRFQF